MIKTINTESKNQQAIVPEKRAVARAYSKYLNAGFGKMAEVLGLPVEVEGLGCKIWDEDGNQYLDCGGYGVFILGHRHPYVVEAVKKQLDRHPLSTRCLLGKEITMAAETIIQKAPVGLGRVFFVNSGAEATELGLKLAKANGHNRFISTENGFHGKTCGALSVTGKEQYKKPFGDLLKNVDFVPYADVEAINRAIGDSGKTTAVIIEPVQGEGGVIIPPKGYLSTVRQICDETGALFIVDEIQSGMARLGTWWGVNEEDVVPDIMLVGKGLSGGIIPVSAVLGKEYIFSPLDKDPLLHSSTFAGNPLAMVAAQAALEAIDLYQIPQRAKILGEQLLLILKATFGTICENLVTDVRGKGLLLGIEFCKPHVAADAILRLLDHKVIVNTSLNLSRVIRFTPPAIMNDDEVRWFEKSCRSVSNELINHW